MMDVMNCWTEDPECERGMLYCFQLSMGKALEVFDKLREAISEGKLEGNFEETFAWAISDGGSAEIDLTDAVLRLFVLTEPEGDDRLDGMHPHWNKPNDQHWLRALIPAKALLN